MKGDISALKNYHKYNKSFFPIFEYAALEEIMLGYKDFQRYCIRTERYPITLNETKSMVQHLCNSDRFEDRVYALEIAMTWVAALRT